MDGETKSMNDVEAELEAVKKRADALEKDIHEAEVKHPPPLDHAEDGGVI